MRIVRQIMLQPYYPQRRRRVPSTDPFFDDGNVEWALMVQQQSQQQQHQQGGDTDSQPERPHQPSNWSTQEILCSYSGCNTSFPDPLAYEAHLQAAHRLVCRVCRRVYPTPKMLELHVLENHDTLFKVMAERGEKMVRVVLLLLLHLLAQTCMSIALFCAVHMLCGRMPAQVPGRRQAEIAPDRPAQVPSVVPFLLGLESPSVSTQQGTEQ